MTIDHAASLHYDGHREYAKKRLQKLKAAGLISERPRKQFEQSILFLKRGGLIVLRDDGILNSYPDFDILTLTRRARVSDMTLRHELAVLDLKVAFYTAASLRPDLSIVEFSTWPLLNQFNVPSGTVKPDALVRLKEKSGDGTVRDHSFYVELDRSTEPLRTLVERARSYAHHRKLRTSGAVSDRSARNGQFRVLYVLRSDERRANIAQRLLTSIPPIPSLVSLATFPDAKRDPFSAIWRRPVDYKAPCPNSTQLLNPMVQHTENLSTTGFPLPAIAELKSDS